MTIYSGYLPQILQGTWITIQVACCSLSLGLVLGLLGAVLESSKWLPIRSLATAIISIVRGTPELLFLFFIYFGGTLLMTGIMGHYVNVSAFLAGVLGLAMIFGSYASQVFRGAFLAIPIGQIEAARALGLNRPLIFFHIQLPQAWRHALPGLGNLWLVLLKDTALVSLIGLGDLMNRSQVAASTTHQPFLFYLTAALLYLILTTVSQGIMQKLSSRSAKHTLTESGEPEHAILR